MATYVYFDMCRRIIEERRWDSEEDCKNLAKLSKKIDACLSALQDNNSMDGIGSLKALKDAVSEKLRE